MSVIWSPSFSHKHIVVVGDALSFVEMVKQGITIYNDRLYGTGDNEKAKGKVKAGLMKGGNTLVITNKGGFEAMTAWVLANGVHGAKAGTNTIPIQTGAIIQAKDTTNDATLSTNGGSIRVGIKIDGGNKEVYHLEGYTPASGVYTAEQVIDRNQLLRGLLGGPAKDVDGRAAYQVPDKLIRIIDGFSTGDLTRSRQITSIDQIQHCPRDLQIRRICRSRGQIVEKRGGPAAGRPRLISSS